MGKKRRKNKDKDKRKKEHSPKHVLLELDMCLILLLSFLSITNKPQDIQFLQIDKPKYTEADITNNPWSDTILLSSKWCMDIPIKPTSLATSKAYFFQVP